MIGGMFSRPTCVESNSITGSQTTIRPFCVETGKNLLAYCKQTVPESTGLDWGVPVPQHVEWNSVTEAS